MEELVREHLALARTIARTIQLAPTTTCDRDDFYSAALIGLVKAARTFDPTRGTRFQTYARSWIEGSIRDEYRNHRSLVSQIGRKTITPIPIRQGDDDGETEGNWLGAVSSSHETASDLWMDLDVLETREREIIVKKFWYGALGRELAVAIDRTPQRVSQLKSDAFDRLRRQWR